MKQYTSFSQLYKLGQTSHVPVLFTSFLSQLYSLKDDFLLEDDDFEVPVTALENSMIVSIFQKQFVHPSIADCVLNYCVAVSIVKVLIDAEQELKKAKEVFEKQKREYEQSQSAWPQFMPYIGDDERIEQRYQHAYHQLIVFEELVDQIQRLAKRAFKRLNKKLGEVEKKDTAIYHKTLEEMYWVESYFSNENQIRRLQLLLLQHHQ